MDDCMKFLPIVLISSLLPIVHGLSAQAEVEAATEVVIPTEISEPPYAVGDLISEQGHYIAQDDGTTINFRLVNNLIRIYWLDANRLIMEPPVNAATVRFTGSVRGRPYNRANRLAGEPGLGAPGAVLPPHSLNVVLVLSADGEDDSASSYAFRYTPDMDVPKETQP